ncbi:glycine cleavage system aminomethyltransferase GcvT [Miniphocaeibacter halophilus]|uniref:Glycine cleavage system aminomethyltransferase GcvT n=1 Tax=Miniphocaeibacter halophilus TaxID=2931922 RepID=A0AC61MRC8_9FIRM|nr:glycine cleavage system aminomethyltransferase GcvT [Miniphocaeibacter halophilus]QQK07888.1 glycine cleavage system aminomethyltransferase GcvT [Miniphocaeibacter halophilus]
MSAKKTPLYDRHIAAGGNVVDYAGWMLPVDYVGLKEEHKAVRENVGLFDVSHMGEFDVKGKEALKFLNYVCSNDFSKAADGQIVYTMLCNENGGIIDDLLVYKYNNEHFLMVPNAANTEKDYNHLIKYVKDYDVEFNNISDNVGEVAIQGPNSQKVLQKLVDFDLDQIKYYHFVDDIDYKGHKLLISRTGYTGEDGFEVYTTPEGIQQVWDDLLEIGKEFELQLCGLGCRDTLRFEASMPLYGNEMGDDISPLEAGLKFAVKFDKDDFIGKAALEKELAEGPKRKIIGLEMEDKRIPRHGYEIQKDGKKIGVITTGYLSPTLNRRLANVLIDIDEAVIGNEVDVIVRNKVSKAKIISKKFMK